MKPTLKNVTADKRSEAFVAFAQTIDFTELFNRIKSTANVWCEFDLPEISTKNGAVDVSFMSDDIAPQTGVFAAVLERCHIRSFCNGVFWDGKVGKLAYWVCVFLWYEHKDGTSDGMELLRAMYSGGEWTYPASWKRKE